MTSANPAILAFVEQELSKDPELTSTELQEKTREIDAGVAKLTGRQFHAQYALQIRRKLFGGAPSRGKRARVGRSETSSALGLLAEGYAEKKAALNEAIEQAFKRALENDSVAAVNHLFSVLDRH